MKNKRILHSFLHRKKIHILTPSPRWGLVPSQMPAPYYSHFGMWEIKFQLSTSFNFVKPHSRTLK